jgi:iron transport multicopper oxidase
MGRFTPRGIVALVFSCISGILGVAVVAWYGLADVKKTTYDHARQRIAEAHVPADSHQQVVAPEVEPRPETAEVVTVAGGGAAAARA